MWQIKKFKTKEQMDKFINTHSIQWEQVFINWTGKKNEHRYAIEYRYLRVINL